MSLNPFINTLDDALDPLIELNPIIQYAEPVLNDLVCVGYTGANDLEIGVTTYNVIRKAENYIRYNIFSEERVSGNTICGISGSQSYKYYTIESVDDSYDNTSLVANDTKNLHIMTMRNRYLNDIAWLKGRIAKYDALMNDIDIEDVQDLITNVNMAIKKTEYLTYQFLNQVLGIHIKSDVVDLETSIYDNENLEVQERVLCSKTRHLVYNVERHNILDEVLNFEKGLVYDLIEGTLLRIVTEPETYVPKDKYFTYEHMLQLNIDLEKIFDIVSLIPFLNQGMIDLFNALLKLKYELVKVMDNIRYESEKVLISISKITNELPYIVGEFLLDTTSVYDKVVKRGIRLTPIENSYKR